MDYILATLSGGNVEGDRDAEIYEKIGERMPLAEIHKH